MKQILAFLTALMFIPAWISSAEGKDKETTPIVSYLMSFEDTEGTTLMSIKGFMLSIAKSSMKEGPARHLLDEIGKITVFTMEEASKEDKKKFDTGLKPVLESYMPVTEIKEEDSSTAIYIDAKSETGFKEMVMHITGKESAIMVLGGEFTIETFEKIAPEDKEEQNKQI